MHKSFYFLLFSFLFFISCKPSIKKDLEADNKENKTRTFANYVFDFTAKDNQNLQKAYNSYINSFSLEEKIAQLFIKNINGNSFYEPNEYFDDGKPVIAGGYIFFGYNLAATSQKIIDFTSSVFQYCNNNKYITPFLAIDHEGGSVNRLRIINAPLESCLNIASTYSVEKAASIYDLQAKQLYSLGFNMNLAPVAEICTSSNIDFLGERSFGDKSQVVSYASACVSSYEKNNVTAVVKHFPGNTNTDPHLGLPVINLSKEEMFLELESFEKVLKQKPGAVLMSHAIVDSVDKGVPSCLSKVWVTDILKNKYGYDGLILSDDIFMAALSKNGYDTKTSVIMAINAGIDCIMISGKNIKDAVFVLKQKAEKDDVFLQKIEAAFSKIISHKIKNGLLCYSMQSDGSYVIKNNVSQKSNIERNDDFNLSKQKNLELYSK